MSETTSISPAGRVGLQTREVNRNSARVLERACPADRRAGRRRIDGRGEATPGPGARTPRPHPKRKRLRLPTAPPAASVTSRRPQLFFLAGARRLLEPC
jgi:hypothetical protein